MNKKTSVWMTLLLVGLASSPVLALGPTVEYIHTDTFGTPIAVTDENGNVIERFEYEPYGLQVSGPVADGPGYTGHVEDTATGLTYMQQRYYDPGIGLFLSVDPVTAYDTPGQNFSRYWYTNGNPTTYVDPDGRERVAVMMNTDVRDLMSGTISREEYTARHNARGMGAVTAVSAVGAAASTASGVIAVVRVLIGRGSVTTMKSTAAIAGSSEVVSEAVEMMSEVSKTDSIEVNPSEVVSVATAFVPGGKAGLLLASEGADLAAQAVEHYQEEKKKSDAQPETAKHNSDE